MDRRSFLASMVALLPLPGGLVANSSSRKPQKYKPLMRLSLLQTDGMESFSDGLYLVVHRDKWSTKWDLNGINDIVDCHGISATRTICDMMIEDLEYGRPIAWETRDGIPGCAVRGQRRMTVTKFERVRLRWAIAYLRRGIKPMVVVDIVNMHLAAQ